MSKSELDQIPLHIRDISKAYATKKISPVELTNYMLERIKKKDDLLNSYITVNEDAVYKAARNVEKEIMTGSLKSPLHGVPIALKDLIYTKNMKTTMGSKAFENFVPTYDASVVTKLKEAGAIIIGKANTHELAYGATGDYSYYGPTRNPYHTDKISGGSSSGSAVAVAESMAVGALGTDTGGSVRIPASYCGIIGMKPTIGSISKYGVHPLSYTMDHIGPMTKDVIGNAVLLNYLVGKDYLDPHSVSRKKEDFTAKIGETVTDIVVGIPKSYYENDSDEKTIEQMNELISSLKSIGITVKILELPLMDDILIAGGIIAHSEVYAHSRELASEDECSLGEQTRERILSGNRYQAFEYVEAQQSKYRYLREFSEIFKRVDFIITPTVPIVPPKIDERKITIGNNEHLVLSLLTKFTIPFNFLGLPSMSVPWGFTSDGMPFGIQIIGKNFDEANIYKLAYTLQK